MRLPIVLTAVALVTAGCGPDPTVQFPARGEEPAYSAAEFGGWWDADGDCQDTRNEILIRDLDNVVLDGRGCLVLSGTLVDSYTGERVEFVRGRTTSHLVQIDHIYAKKDAWEDGAAEWTYEDRRRFANDESNLVATKGSVNGSKGARGPAEWLPPLESARCGYLSSYLLVAGDWNLEVDPVDRTAVAREFDECTSEPALTSR